MAGISGNWRSVDQKSMPNELSEFEWSWLSFSDGRIADTTFSRLLMMKDTEPVVAVQDVPGYSRLKCIIHGFRFLSPGVQVDAFLARYSWLKFTDLYIVLRKSSLSIETLRWNQLIKLNHVNLLQVIDYSEDVSHHVFLVD